MLPILVLTGLLFLPYSSANLPCNCLPFDDKYRMFGRERMIGSGVMIQNGRMIGGKKVTWPAFSWQVSIQKKAPFYWSTLWTSDSSIIGLHHCGGFIVNQFFVVTAAHCFYNFLFNEPMDFSNYRVGYTSLNLIEIFDLELYKYIVSVRWPEKQNKKRTPSADIALVEVDTPFYWTEVARPACLPPSDLIEQYQGVIMVTGWGLTEAPVYTNDGTFTQLNHPKLSKDLKVGYFIDVTPAEECNDNRTEILCVYNHTSVEFDCQGDSGGPVHVKNKDGVAIVIGVVSSTPWDKRNPKEIKGCNQLSFHTRVSTQMDWIKSVIGSRPLEDFCM